MIIPEWKESATTSRLRKPHEAHKNKCLQPLWAQSSHTRPSRGNDCIRFGSKIAPRSPQDEMSATTLGPRWPQEALKSKCLQPLWPQEIPSNPQDTPKRKCLQPCRTQEGSMRPTRRNVCNHFGPMERKLHFSIKATTVPRNTLEVAIAWYCRYCVVLSWYRTRHPSAAKWQLWFETDRNGPKTL